MAISSLLIAALLTSAQTVLPFVPASTPIDNDLVKVENSATAPGKPGKPHDHPTSRVLIYFDPGANDIAFQDGSKRHEVFQAGTVLWNDPMGIHTATISGQVPVNLMHVEIKSSPKQVPTVQYGARDPVKVASGNYKVEIENNQVRVLRLTLAPGQETPLQDEPFARLVVPITPGTLSVTGADGKPHTVTDRQAAARWAVPGVEADRNSGTTPYEALIVEFRR